MLIHTRKIRILLALFIGVMTASSAFIYGVYAEKYDLFPVPELTRLKRYLLADSSAANGRYRPARDDPDGIDETLQKQLDQLHALAYLSGSTARSDRGGVTQFVPEAAFHGLNLEIDGHRPAARIRTMAGDILHQWSMDYATAFPDAEPSNSEGRTYWRRVHLLPDGGLIAIFEGQGLIQLDRESRLVWANDMHAHHDLEVLDDGTIYVLGRRAEILPRINEKRPVLHDFISVLDAEGREQRTISILEAFERSPYHPYLAAAPREGDMLHTNTLELLDDRLSSKIPAFNDRSVLISLCYLNTIAVVDLDDGRVSWAVRGPWHCPHQPTILSNGNLMILDNGTRRSRVIELDPATQQIAWMYDGREHDFFTATCGSNQRLPNGNTLITESDYGRAFEVSPENDIVWEFYTPHRAGANKEFIATLFEVIRLPSDSASSWLSYVSDE